MMSHTTQHYRRLLERAQGRRQAADTAVHRARKALTATRRSSRRWEGAQRVIQTVAQATQQELAYHVEEPVSLALASVFPDPYSFQVSFEVRRNQTEADLSFIRGEDGEPIHPLSACGGGTVDVAAFALRATLWQLSRGRARATLVQDEPFRFVSRNLQSRASALLREVSSSLGLQLVIVSHEQRLIEEADRVFTVRMEDGVSVVETT